MPILVRNKKIDRKVERLAKRQPGGSSKESLVAGVMEKVVELCRKNPTAWHGIGTAQEPASPPATAPTDNGQAAVDPSDSTLPVAPATHQNGAQTP